MLISRLHRRRQIHGAVRGNGQRNGGGAFGVLKHRRIDGHDDLGRGGAGCRRKRNAAGAIGKRKREVGLDRAQADDVDGLRQGQAVAGVGGKQQRFRAGAHLRGIGQLSDGQNGHAAHRGGNHDLAVRRHLGLARKIFGHLQAFVHGQVIGRHDVQHRGVIRRRDLGVDQVSGEIPGVAADVKGSVGSGKLRQKIGCAIRQIV